MQVRTGLNVVVFRAARQRGGSLESRGGVAPVRVEGVVEWIGAV